MKNYRFKGGPIALNSGGMGPDDYLLKTVKGGRWYRVIMRYGRHFSYDEVLGDYEGSRENAENDLEAFRLIIQTTFRICVGDNAERWGRDKVHIPTITAEEFLKKYYQARVFRMDNYGRIIREVI